MGGFGEKLRRERELRGVSLREIADGTKISLRFLQALEDDRVETLPGGLFPRAFVKQYATFLGLDADRTVADFVATHGEFAPERKPVAPPPARRPIALARAPVPGRRGRGRGGAHAAARAARRARPAAADADAARGPGRAADRPRLPRARVAPRRRRATAWC